MRTRVVFVLLFVLSIFTKAHAQTDTSFWFAMPHVIGNADRDTPILIRVMPVDLGSNVRIYTPAAPSVLDTTIWVDAGGVKSINLTKLKALLENIPHGQVLNRGIKIESDQYITAYFDESSTRNPEIYALKGQNALGTAFYVPGQTTYTNNTADGTLSAYNAFDIVATEDGTVVTITLTNDIVGPDGTTIIHKASDGPFTVTLNRGQTYSCRAASRTPSKHLGGSTISSNKQVAVTMVDDFVNVGGCSDAGGDQLVPISILGTEYASVSGYFSDNDQACIMAMPNYPSTVVTITVKIGTGAATTSTVTLSGGQSYQFPYTSNANGAVYIKSTNPIGVMHMTGIGCEISYAALPPLGSCIGSRKVGIVRPGGYDTYLILVAPKISGSTAIAGGFLFNGSTGVIKASDFTDLPGNPSWQYARVGLNTTVYPARSSALITNTQNVKFHAGIIYGQSGVGGSYGYFSSYAVAPTVTPPDDTVFCNKTITGELKFKSTVNGSKFEWVNDNTAIGLAASGAGDIPSFLAVNNSNVTIYAHISVVPKANDCDGIPRSFTITVHPTPKLVVSKKPAPLCIPKTADITADSLTSASSTPGMTLRYYTNRTLTDTVLNPKKISASGKFYIQGTSAQGCLSNIDSVEVIINGIPVISAHNPPAVCPGETADLTDDAIIAGNPSGLNYAYYKDPTSGIQYKDSTKAPKGTYYIIATNISGCASSPVAVDVTEKINSVAADIAVRDTAICKNASVILTASSEIAGASFKWYRNSTLKDSIGVGATYTTNIIKGDSTYYVAVTGTLQCTNVSGTGAVVKVKMKNYAVASNITVRDTAVCDDSKVKLTATSTLGGTFKWYRSSSLSSSDSIGTGATYTTDLIKGDSTYYVTIENSTYCANQSGTGAVIKVTKKDYGVAADVKVPDTAICVGGSVKLIATADAGSTITWYSNAALTSYRGTGYNYTTGNILADSVFYVTIENSTTCKNKTGTATVVHVTKKDYATAASITVKDTTACKGSTVTLTASTTLAGGTIKWYRSSTLVDTIRTGTQYVTGAINADSTYYVTAESATSCASQSGVAVHVIKKEYATAANITVSDAAVCKGDVAILKATSSVGTIKWYRKSNLTDSVGVGTQYTTKAIMADSTYYLTVSSTALCANMAASAAVVKVTKKEYGTAANITAGNATACIGTTVGLTASNSVGGDIKWYRDPSLLDSAGFGPNFTSDVVNGDQQYYLTVSSTTLCANKATDLAVVTVTSKGYATAANITVTDASACKGTTVNLAASSNAGLIKWYRDVLLTDSVGVGTTYTTKAINADSTYYLSVEGTALCANKPSTGAVVKVVKKEYATSTDITAAGTAVCKNSTAVLTATSSAGTIKWYRNAGLTDSIAVGGTYTTNNILADSTYYLTVESTTLCKNQSGSAAVVKVTKKEYATAANLTIRDTAICQDSKVKLTAFTSLTGTIKWYRNSALTDSIGVGVSYTTNLIKGDSVYYLSIQNSAYCANLAGTGADVVVKMKTYGIAADVKVPDTAICVGGTVSLPATATAGSVITWYSNAGLTNYLDTGYHYTTGSIMADSVFYVTIENATTCKNKAGTATAVHVTKKDYADAATIFVRDTTACKGSTVALAASTTLTGGILKWYRNTSLNDTIRTGTQYLTGAIDGDSTYYVTVENTATCASPTGVALHVIKKDYATAANITTSNVAVCKNEIAVLNASSSAGTIKWYRNSTLTDSIATGTSYTTQSVLADSTYYLTVSGTAYCANQTGSAAVITVTKKEYALAANISVADATACKGTTIDLTASSTAGVIKWYRDVLLLDSAGVGTTFTTDVVNADQEYYLTVAGTTLCANKAADAAVVKVTKKGYATAADIAVADTTACKGTSVLLTASSSVGVIKWYRDNTLTDSVGVGATYTTNAIDADSSYYVSVEGTALCANKPTDAAVVKVVKKEYATSSDITAVGVAVCKSTTAVLTASSTAGVITWYRDLSLTDSVGTGETYITNNIEADSVYYVTVAGSALCENQSGAAAVVNVTKKDYATAADITAGNAAVCKGDVAHLTASSIAGDIKWYRDAALTDSVGAGTSYTTDVINADATYYLTVAGATLCANKAADAAIATVLKKEYATASDLNVFDTSACIGTTTLVRANSTSGTIKWYRDANLTDSIGIGDFYTTNPINADSFYYATVNGAALCENKAGYAAMVTVIKRVYATAGDLDVFGTSVCRGETADLSATSLTTGIITWYRDELLTQSVSVGNTYTTNPILEDSLYYVTISGANFCANEPGNAAIVKVKKKEYAVAGDLTVADLYACKGTTVNLTATTTGLGVVKWYRDALLADSVGVGNTYTTNSIEADSIYYATISSAALCANKVADAAVVKVTKNEYATAADLTATDAIACRGTTVALTAASSVGTINWYSDALLKYNVATGVNYTTPAIEGDSTYYLTVSSTTLCANKAADAVIVKVKKKEYAVATDVTVSDAAICKGSVAVLTASSGGDVIKWYRNATLTDSVGVGGTYTTNTIEADSVYYVTVSGTTFCENKTGDAAIVNVTKKEYAVATDLTVANVAACKGSVVDLTAGSSLGTIKWYRDALLTDSVGVGTTYTIDALLGDSVYYVTVSGATVCANKTGDAAVVNVTKKEYAVATDLNTADAAVCKGAVADLTATSSGGTVKWYRDYRLTDSIAVGTAYTTNTIDADSIYYVTVSGTTLCANKIGQSAVVKVAKKEYAVATDVTVADAAICIGSTADLTATANGTIIKWYRDNLLTDSVGMGSMYTTNAIMADSVYYVTTAGSTLCANKTGDAAVVHVIKKEYATQADITASNAAVCIGDKAALTASSGGGAITWYRDALLTDSVGAGTNYTTNVIAADSMYYLTVAGATLCANKTGSAAVVKVTKKEYATTADVTVPDASVCRGSVAQLFATTAAANTIKWYVNSQLTDSVGVGVNYTTDAIESDMEYYVAVSSTTLCSNKAGMATLVKVTKKEYNTAGDVSVPDVSVCKGSTALVTATASGSVIKWYRDALLTDSVGVGTSYTTKVINADSVYYLTTYSATSCANKAEDAAMVNVIKKEYAVAADLTLTDMSVCKGSTALLTATSVADTIQWYRDGLLTDKVATGGIYTTNAINADSLYYVTTSSTTLCANKAGTAGVVKVTKKEYALAGDLTVANVAACKGSLVDLTAGSNLGTIKWYRDASLTDSVGVGTTYTTNALLGDSIYYVTVSGATVCANKAGDAAVVNVTKKEYAVASDLSAADASVCKGSVVGLTASSAAGTIKWYRDYRLTDNVATGTAYTTNAIESDSVYYVTVSGTTLCANKSGTAAVVRVTKKEYAVAADLTVADAAICKGATAQLTATATGTVIKWYRNSLLTDSVGVGGSYTTNAILADSVYYVTTASSGLCANKAGEAAVVTVVKKEFAAPGDITAANAAVCIGDKAMLTAASNGGDITWYRDALLTDSVGAGTNYTTNVIAADSMYYLTVAGTTLCANKAGNAAVVKVTKKEYATTADVTVADASVCRGSVAQLSAATAAANTIKWYVNSQLTDSVGVGTRYTTEAIESDMEYYVAVSSSTLCSNKAGTAAVVKVTKKEYSIARDVTVPDVSVCKGSTALVTASASGSVIKWYRDALLTDSVGVGTSYTTKVINADSIYYLTTYGATSCANKAEDAAMVNVIKKEYAVAADLTLKDVSVCKGSTALLTAASVADTIQWYRDGLLTDRVATGVNYTTNTINADSLYYVTASSSTLCANKAGTAGMVKVIKKEYAVAGDLTVADAVACKGSTVVLAASSVSDTIRWYRDALLTDSVGVGKSYTTNAIESDSLYYVTTSGTTLCANKSGFAAIVKVTKKEYAVAGDISVSDTVICRGSTVQLAAVSNITAGKLEWYTDETLTNKVGDGITYTSESISENTTYYVTVNNVEKCANKVNEARPLLVSMKDIPSITNQPRGIGSLCEGRGTAYSLVSSGVNVSYQWQLDKGDGSWFVDMPGETTNQLSLPAIDVSMDGYRYRVVVSNECGDVNSSIVITSVKSKPKVIGDPADRLVCEKQDALFGVAAEGFGTLKYVWQVDKKNGSGFSTIAEAITDSITVAGVTESMNGYVYRCIVSGGCSPSDTSNMAALTVPVAKVGDITNQALCNNALTQAVNLTSSIANTNFAWVNNNSTVGLASSGTNSTIPAFTAVNKGVDADSAVITITPEAFGCIGPVKNFTIVVNPTPVISSTTPVDICSNSEFTYAIKSSTEKTTFKWSRSVVSGISNDAATGTGNITETLVSTATESKVVTYSYTLEAAGCSNVQPVKVKVKPTPVAIITGKDICAEETLLLTGAADLTNVTYNWTDALGKNSTEKTYEVSNATTAASGTYLLVAAKDGCNSVPASYVAKVKPLPVATITGTSGVCVGKDIVLTGSSDIGADSYAWTGPSGFTNNLATFTLANATDLYQGTYNLVIEKDGCKSHATTSAVQVNQYPVVTIEKSTIACESSSAWVKAYSSLPLSTYVWQGMGQSAIDQEMIIKPVTGDVLKYYVTVSRYGCAVRDSVEFVVKKSPVVQLPAIADVCQSVAPFNLSASETTGLSGQGVFSGASVTTDGLFNPSIAAGTYVITYTYTSSEGCKDAKTVSFKVYPIPGVNAGSDKSMYEGNSVRLDGSISGNYTKYTWSELGNTAAVPSMNTLTPMVNPSVDKTYVLAAENSYGCKAQDEVNVTVLKLRIPNSFSPNGDGKNDEWNIPGLSKYPNSRVEIYNRWGVRLFLSKGYVKAWDGKYNGSYVPAATYYYLIYLNDGIGNEKPVAGWVEVMR